ncbi:MAG: hypothetical protein ABI759_23115 [Candidatus Solibacter sp.]
MKFWVRRIHIYLGLFNFTLLCVFGLAGLVVTAEAPDIFRGGSVPVVASVPFQAPGAASDKEVGALIGQTLQPRHAGKPNVRRNENRQLVADFYSVNGLVRATLLENEGRLNVETRRNSIWRFIDNAHATTPQESASSWAVNAWAWYIEISIWSLLLMSLSGIWLGLTTRWPYWWTKAALATGTTMFFVFYWAVK